MKLTIGRTESNKPFTLPVDAVTQKIAMLARTGGGKTYAAKVLAEEFLHARFPICALDPLGVWWGLRAEGESRGYEVLIAGGDHQDIPLESASGKIIAEFFVRERVPMILDLSRFGENEMRRFVADFATELYHRNRDVMHLFVDEADEFAPQGGGKSMGAETGRCLGAMQNVVRRGRARGIGCTLITQRSAVLSKSVLTQTEALFCFQTTGPQDLAAIDGWIQYHGTVEERKQIMGSLTKLQRGECWFYSPAWMKTLEKLHIRKLRTFDSSRTPQPGESIKPPKSIADVNLPALTERMKACVEEAKANDPRALKAEIMRLRKELVDAVQSTPTDPDALKKAVDRAVEAARREFVRAQGKREAQLHSAITTLQRRMTKARESLDLNGFNLPPDIKEDFKADEAIGALFRAAATRHGVPGSQPLTVSVNRGGGRRETMAVPGKTHDGITKPQQRVLDALAWWANLGVNQPTRNQVGLVARISASGGYFDNTIGPLSAAGYITRGQGTLSLTDAGFEMANEPADTQTIDQYHDVIRAQLKGSTLRFFNTLVENYATNGTDAISREELGAKTGISPAGGYFDNSIGPLGTMGLIQRRAGMIEPTDLMFPPDLVGV